MRQHTQQLVNVYIHDYQPIIVKTAVIVLVMHVSSLVADNTNVEDDSVVKNVMTMHWLTDVSKMIASTQ